MANKDKEGSVFREKTLDKVSGPESLNDYIKVTTPSVWIVLIALVVLLCGILAWSIFGRVEKTNEDGAAASIAPITYVIDNN